MVSMNPNVGLKKLLAVRAFSVNERVHENDLVVEPFLKRAKLAKVAVPVSKSSNDSESVEMQLEVGEEENESDSAEADDEAFAHRVV